MHEQEQVHDERSGDWFDRCFSLMSCAGAEGTIRYARGGCVHRPRGLAVIVTGRTEYIEKYRDVLYDLRDTGYHFCVYDHFGQGGSARGLDDPEKGHVTRFSTYVADLMTMIDMMRRDYRGMPLVLLCHSMGGTVGIIACRERPGAIDGLVLASPMLQVNTGLLPERVACAVSAVGCRLGWSGRYVPGGRPFRERTPFSGNLLTRDERRFNTIMTTLRQRPELRIGDPTFGWLHAACDGMRRARSSASAIACPAVVLAALSDSIVNVAPMERFTAALPDGRLFRYPGARHELFMERDETRSAVLDVVRTFLANRLATDPAGKSP